MRGPYIFTGGKKIFHSDRNKRSEGNGKRLARLIKERMRDSRDMQINGIAPYTYTVEKGKISLRRYLVFSNGKIRFNAPAFPDIIAFCQTVFVPTISPSGQKNGYPLPPSRGASVCNQ